MTKDTIVDVIKKHIVENLEDIESADQIDVNKSMKDYGANSLDIIEIVSCAMRELEIKVPRAELAEIATIDQLADKFFEYLEDNTN